MSKSVVYGQQVQIRLLTSDYKPLIIDWNKLDATALSMDRAYMAIGKRQARHHSMGSGVKLVLSRTKKDNYLKALMFYNQSCINRGIEPLQFVIQEIITHAYNFTAIDPSSELGEGVKLPDPTKNLDNLAKVQKILDQIELLKKVSENTASKFGIDGKMIVDHFKNDKNIGKFVNAATQLQTKVVEGQRTAIDLIAKTVKIEQDIKDKIVFLQAQIAIIFGQGANAPQPFKEKYNYIDCSMSEETWSHAVHEGTLESAVFHSSAVECENDFNWYDDGYADIQLSTSIMSKFLKQSNKIKETYSNAEPALLKQSLNDFHSNKTDFYNDIKEFTRDDF